MKLYDYATAHFSLDNEATCCLLEDNYEKYSMLMSNCKIEIPKQSSPVEVKLEENDEDDFNLEDLIQPLSCSGKIVCDSSESITDEDVSEFLAAYRQKPNKVKPQVNMVERETKMRTIAKSFAPQSCNAKDKKINKFNRGVGEVNPKEQPPVSYFKTAKEELDIQNLKKYGTNPAASANGGQKRKLGTRRGVHSKFVSPVLSNGDM